MIDTNIHTLSRSRLTSAKRSYVTRRINSSDITTLITGAHTPKPGDLILARVDKIGQHTRLESIEGRRQYLFPGDEIILAYGNRYASEQFEAIVPTDLSPCDLVAAGGIAAQTLSRHKRLKNATKITPLGLLGDSNGNRLNLMQYAIPCPLPRAKASAVIGVFGSAMDAGKTTTVANIVRGLKNAGIKVGVAKVTGTGSGPDAWKFKDAGADVVLDFTDAGFASTYLTPLSDIENCAQQLVENLTNEDVDVIILEFADGLLQSEASKLLSSKRLHKLLDAAVFAASDAMNALFGCSTLIARKWKVLFVSGVINTSPLQCAEYTAQSHIPLLDEEDLIKEDIYQRLKFWIDNYQDLSARAI